MHVSQLIESTDTVTNDLLRLLVGDRVGFGMSRNVFVLHTDDKLVVKVERDSYMFQNVLESHVWNAVCFTEQRRWLAPVRAISPCGTCLLMDRTLPVAAHDLPKFVPVWLTDTKADNWGWLDGRVVCHDYGFNLTMEEGISKKVKRANWH